MPTPPLASREPRSAATTRAVDEANGRGEHGTYVRYTIGECRCDPCRKANSDYEKRRKRLKAYGRFPWVDPERSRRRLLELMDSGCGVRTIARVSGVSRTTLNALISGKPDASVAGGRRPLMRVQADTERRLLDTLEDDVRQPDTVDATEVWEKIEEMVAFGLPKARIAWAMGKKRPALQISRDRVSPANAKAVADVHWGLWLHCPQFRAVCGCPLPAGIQRRLETSA